MTQTKAQLLGVSTVTGDITLSSDSDIFLKDSGKLILGNGSDLQISHNGTDTLIKNNTGWFVQSADSYAFKTNDETKWFMALSSNAVKLYYNNDLKLETISGGCSVTGALDCDSFDCSGSLNVSGNATFHGNLDLHDNDLLRIGTGDDLQLYHDGVNKISATSGALDIRTSTAADIDIFTNDGLAIKCVADGSTNLYYDGSKKFETVSGGALVTGQLRVDGNCDLYDNKYLRLGDSADMVLYHDGTNSYLKDVGVGSLRLASDSPIYIQKNTGGENIAVFTPDGSVDLYHDNEKKFETTSSGASISKSGSAANCKLEIAQSGGGGGTSEILFSDSVSGRGRVFFNHGSTPEVLNLEAAGTIGLSVATTGNVGIGTTSPNAKLAIHTTSSTVASSQLFRITTANGAIFGIETDETISNPTWKIGGVVNSGTAEPLAFYQIGSEVARIDSSGRVLIGGSSNSASSHADELQIINTSAQGGLSIITADDSQGNIYFGHSGGTADGRIEYSHNNDYMRFYTANGERARIDSNGRLGINETSPETLLHISDGTANDGPIILIEGSGQNAANNLLGGINFRNLDSSGDGPTITGAIRHRTANATGNGGYLTFHTHDGSEGGEGSDAVERLRIGSDGVLSAGATVLLKTDINWTTDTYQRAHIFSGASGGTPADGVVIAASPLENAVGQRIGAFAFGCKTSSTADVGNSGLKAVIEGHTNANPGDAWKAGSEMRFLTRPDNGNLSERLRIDSVGRVHIGSTNNTGVNTKFVVGAGNNINTTAIINTGDVDVDALTLSNWDGSTATTKLMMHFDSSGVGGWNIGIPAATDAFVIEDDGGTAVLTLDANNDSTFAGIVQVNANDAATYAAQVSNDGNNANRYGLVINCGTDDGSGTNYAIRFADGDGGEQGYITFSSGTVTYGAFTAHHPCIVPNSDNPTDASNAYPYGTLLETISIEYTQKNGSNTERGIRYKVQKTQSVNSRKVLGAYGSSMNGGPDNQTNEHQALILGDGHIICNNAGGDIEVGDGICSSATAGIGQKATANPSMIVGIAQEAVTFTGSETKLVAVQYGLQQFIPW